MPIKTLRFRKPTKSRTLRSNRIREAIRASKSKRLQEINELRQIHEISQVQKLKITLMAVIWGHGSLTQTPFINRMSERLKLNIYGLGVAGCGTWGSKEYFDYINNTLLSGQIINENLITKLNNFYTARSYFIKNATSRSAKTTPGTTHSIYTTVTDFGRGKKPRSDKTFSNEENPKMLIIYPDGVRERITQGPVLRIYNFMATTELGEVIAHQISPVDIVLPNNSRLSNIQEAIIHFVENMTMRPGSSKFEIPVGTPYEVELELFDTTCNYTEKEPIMAYLENKTIRRNAQKGEIQILPIPVAVPPSPSGGKRKR